MTSFNSSTFGAEVGNQLFIVYAHPVATGAVSVDNVRLDATAEVSGVPEPSTFVLAALGLAGLGLVAWRRRNRNVE
ncbi:MAG: PEP-CTERM sorting domain-containing protein [Planctomycetes bacterium]|nr:PEP-CTERM sorting domain-containing protein [Planctomycetota bacterium]